MTRIRQGGTLILRPIASHQIISLSLFSHACGTHTNQTVDNDYCLCVPFAWYTSAMKVNSTTTYQFDFPMKDGKKVHSFKIPAESQDDAVMMLYEELMQCQEQITIERRRIKEKDKEPKEEKK